MPPDALRATVTVSMSDIDTRELDPTLSMGLDSFSKTASDTGRLKCVPLPVAFLGVVDRFVNE
jgi:hypothetical protein